ncbi:MAG: hypothetical protein ACRBDI_03055 [Alphaproteobacteria bacterium]
MPVPMIESIEKISDDFFAVSFDSVIKPDVVKMDRDDMETMHKDLVETRGDLADIKKVVTALEL